MTRIVLFTIFLGLISLLASLVNYQDTFVKEENLSVSQMQAEITKYQKRIEELQNPTVAVEVEEKSNAIDPNDPEMQKAIEVYTANCLSCHGEKGAGNEELKAPLISGQHEWYLIDHITKMNKGERAGVEHNFSSISEADLKVLAKYVRRLRVE